MYVKDGDHPRHHKGSHNFRKSGRKKAIYRDDKEEMSVRGSCVHSAITSGGSLF